MTKRHFRIHTHMHDIFQNVNERKHRTHTDPKALGCAAPASRQVQACREAVSGASHIASTRNHPYLREHVCPAYTGVSVYAMFALNRCVFVIEKQQKSLS